MSDIETLIQKAERGDIEIDEYHSHVDSLGLGETEEAFMKMTGASLILENRGQEAVELSENLLDTKYTTDDLIDEVIGELRGMDRVYRRHMGDALSSLNYSVSVIEEVTDNIENASGISVNIDIDSHEHNSYSLFSFGGGSDDSGGGSGGSGGGSSGGSGGVDDEDKRDTLRGIGTLLGAAGLAGLGVGGAALAYDEVTGEPQALEPGQYDVYVSDLEDVETLESSYGDSDEEALRAIGDRLEQEYEDDSDIRVGLKAKLTDEFIDINAGDDLVKRYHPGEIAYEQALAEAKDVTGQ